MTRPMPDPRYHPLSPRPRTLLSRLRYALWRWADNLAAGEEGEGPEGSALTADEALIEYHRIKTERPSRRVAAWLVAVAVGMALCAGVVAWAVMR